ncbi:MAG: VanZ family protein [Roseburia sp.]
MTNTISSMAADRKKRRLAVAILFVLYFVVLFYFLFFSEEMGRTYTERAYHYNLIPFREIKRFIHYRETLGMRSVLLNIVGNVVAFMPFGTFLPVFVAPGRKFWFTALYSFELSLLVETLQLIGKVGSFDVDDLLLNTVGGMLGYGLYRIIMYFWNRRKEAKGREPK